MLTQIERIDDRGIVHDIAMPRGFVPPMPSPDAVRSVSMWRSPGFYLGTLLMVVLLVATMIVRLALLAKRRVSA